MPCRGGCAPYPRGDRRWLAQPDLLSKGYLDRVDGKARNHPASHKRGADIPRFFQRSVLFLAAFGVGAPRPSWTGCCKFQSARGLCSGDQVCVSCHQNEGVSYNKTGHHLNVATACFARVWKAMDGLPKVQTFLRSSTRRMRLVCPVCGSRWKHVAEATSRRLQQVLEPP